MSAIGGSVREIGLDGRLFALAADANLSLNLGGYDNETQVNGDGTARLVKTRVPATLSDINVNMDLARGDLDYLQELRDRSGYWPIYVTLVDGTTYQGVAQINGELVYSTMSATAQFGLSGPGTWTRQ